MPWQRQGSDSKHWASNFVLALFVAMYVFVKDLFKGMFRDMM